VAVVAYTSWLACGALPQLLRECFVNGKLLRCLLPLCYYNFLTYLVCMYESLLFNLNISIPLEYRSDNH